MSLARSWALDLKTRRIRVNVVSPGAVDTPGLRGFSGATSEQLATGMGARIPLGRLGEPEDVAQVVSFLAGSGSSFVTGVEVFVDGGMMLT